MLVKGRAGINRIANEGVDASANLNSSATSAIYLYTGALYGQLDLTNTILKIQKRLKVFIVSAWYCIVDAFEPLHFYEAKMQGKIATHWRNCGLEKIISDLLIYVKPSNVYGFFPGNED